MQSPPEEQRFILVVTDAADRLVDDSGVAVLCHLDRVVLAATTYGLAVQLRKHPEMIVHIFDREDEARRAFALFLP